MDIKKILSQIDSINEGSMQAATKHPTGPKFVGKWKGTDSAAKARSRYVGAAESRNLLQDLESKLNETPVRDIMAEFKEFKKLQEAESVAQDTGSQVFQSMGSQLLAIGKDADKLKHEGADQLKQEIVNKLDQIGDARLSQATKTFLQRVVEFNRNNPKTMAAVFGFTFAIIARVSMQVSHNLGLSPTQATLILEATLPTLGNFLGYLVNGFSVKDSIQSGLIAGGIGVAGTMAASRALGEEIELDVTEDLDEVAMNPTAFAQAIKTGQDKGVLVGFEFETCIPQASVQQWKTGDAPPETPTYDPESTAWVEGKTVADLVSGVASKANGNLGNIMDDLFKNKGSVAAQLGYKSPWDGYRRWVEQQIRERMGSENNTKVVFEKLAELLKDPEVATMPIEYGYSSEHGNYGPSSNWNGRTFTIEILKRETGVDFGKRVPKTQLTAELAEKVQSACHKAYQITRGPYDSRINAVGNALANRRHEIEGDYYLRGYGLDMGADRVDAVKQYFMDFAQQTLGTTDLKELLSKKWAFKGRVNNATPVLKEKLWYYVTAGAEPPASLRQRSYGRNTYKDGAEFLKANLKDVYGDNMEIFTGYHQATKKLDRWYIEPDGSLHPSGDDYSAEVVSPPLPAEKAMAALKTWYQKAKSLKLYTNGSTGLHINVSIPGNLDVLKLAVFAGDQYVLKKFGRENNSYARSVIKNLKGTGDLPKLGTKEFSAAEKEMKSIVRRFSGDHFATVNFNGKYVSFRHAGGDYLNKMDDIVNTVGRFVRSMVIAADPAAYRDEYVGKLVKMMKPEAGDAGSEKLPLSDIRAVATKGIPVQMYDVVYRPIDVNADTLEPNVTGGEEGIRRKIRDSFHSDTPYQIVPDPSVRDRLLNDTTGLATPTKDWIQSAPDSAFVRVVMYPRNRAELDSFGDRLANDSGSRTAAFGMYDRQSNKSAVGSRYTRAIKQGDVEFKDAVTALRGGEVKPAPLPGSKAAPAVQPATFSSQEPDRGIDAAPSNTSNQGNWGIWLVTDRRFSRMPNTIISDNNFRRFDSREAAEQWLEQTRAGNPRMRTDLEVREIEPAQSDNQDQGPGTIERDGVTYGTVPRQQQSTSTDGEDQRYVLFNPTNRMVIQRYHGSLRDTFAVAQNIANRQGHDVGIENSQGEVVDTARTQELDESRIIDPESKVNVIYNPMNSMKRIILAQAVDHAMANKVIASYVHKSQNDPRRVPVKAQDFVLQPVKYDYTTESFDSKQAVIDHFVKQGKTAAQGAAAWERGWRGQKDKPTNMNTFKFKKSPVKSWQELDEYGGTGGYGAASQAPAGTTGSQDDPVKKQQALDQVQIQKSTNQIAPALNAVGASQQVNKAKLTDIMGKLDQKSNQSLPAADLKQLEPLAVAASKALQNPQTAAQLKQVITKADQVDQAKNKQVQQAQQAPGTNPPADQQQPQSPAPAGTKPVGATK